MHLSGKLQGVVCLSKRTFLVLVYSVLGVSLAVGSQKPDEPKATGTPVAPAAADQGSRSSTGQSTSAPKAISGAESQAESGKRAVSPAQPTGRGVKAGEPKGVPQ